MNKRVKRWYMKPQHLRTHHLPTNIPFALKSAELNCMNQDEEDERKWDICQEIAKQI